jgi:uncharacterized membrane protein YhaH (DUF805 family)
VSFSSYLFSFDGRINRAKLWLFILIGLAWQFLILAILYAVFGVAGVSDFAQGRTTIPSMLVGVTGLVAAVAITILILAYLYAAIAVTVKRLHDRDKSAAWLLVFWVLPLVLEIIGAAVAGVMMIGEPDRNTGASLIAVPFAVAALAVVLWGFVELYCLRGTVGDNSFGTDPLANKS